jgi:hypothetical protein
VEYDHWTQQYHLTPSGWQKGTYRFFGKIRGDEIPRPVEAVETWEQGCKQASGWSREEYKQCFVWSSSEVSDDEKIALPERFKSPF